MVKAHLSRDNLINIREMSVPSQVTATEAFSIDLTIKNNALLILPSDPDQCDDNGFPGYELRLGVLVDGGLNDVEHLCAGKGDTNYTINTSGIANPGTYEIEVLVRGRNSFNEVESKSRTIEVVGPFDANNVSVSCDMGNLTATPGETFIPSATVTNDNDVPAEALLVFTANGSELWSRDIQVSSTSSFSPPLTAPQQQGTYSIEAELRQVRSASMSSPHRSPFRRFV